MGYVTALVPSIGVLALFWIAIRAMVQADRRERIAQARIELAQRESSAPAATDDHAGQALGRMGDPEKDDSGRSPDSPDESANQ